MSTLHAALTGLLAAKDETGDRLVHVDTIRDALRRHPAPEAGEVRLGEAESAWVTKLWDIRGRRGRLAEEKFALEQIIEARLAQSAGEVRVEWGVRGVDGVRDIWRGRDEQHARDHARDIPWERTKRTLVSRTVTSFPDVVGEWEEAAGDE